MPDPMMWKKDAGRHPFLVKDKRDEKEMLLWTEL